MKAITAKFDADHQFVKLVNTVYYEDPYGAERRNEGQEFDDLEKELERLGFILSDQSVAYPQPQIHLRPRNQHKTGSPHGVTLKLMTLNHPLRNG